MQEILARLPDDKLMTTDEVAVIFRVSDETVREWVELGWLKYDFRIGKGPMKFLKKSLINFYAMTQSELNAS